MLPLLRLMQLTSTNLPIGGFTYSQGLEWAVEAGWVSNLIQTQQWLQLQIENNLLYCDIPLLARFYHCCEEHDLKKFNYWDKFLLSNRETAELRNEEKQRGKALSQLVNKLCGGINRQWLNVISHNSIAGWAWIGFQWQISLSTLQHGWLFNWLESSVMAAIKLVPLGQQSGQLLIFQLAEQIQEVIKQANQLLDEQLGGSSPLLSIASACHETQYSRLFRS